jgi:hypothetical protein
MRPSPLLAVAAALALATPSLVLVAYRDGPLPAMTGGFGEKTCSTCHFDNRINDRGGALVVAGVPARYEAGRKYSLTVTVRRPDARRAGFELSARFAEGAGAGAQAGTLGAADGRTRVITAPDGTVQYIQHTRAGSDLTSPGEGRWTVNWTAPMGGGGRVVFHVAGNAANDDASPLGDHIYTRTATSRIR